MIVFNSSIVCFSLPPLSFLYSVRSWCRRCLKVRLMSSVIESGTASMIIVIRGITARISVGSSFCPSRMRLIFVFVSASSAPALSTCLARTFLMCSRASSSSSIA